MTHLKENIDYYMQVKKIKMYSHLLIDIANELGIHGKDAYEFAAREKHNFSKMLKGERPLKYEFIIPLEKIFGVSLARLLEEDAFKLPSDSVSVPFNKGFRYYAALDDMELYKNEFDTILDATGKSILCNKDEFDKSFLDYVVEYNAVNGIRYIHNKYGIKLKWYHNQFEFTKEKGGMYIIWENSIPLVRMIANMNDPELFFDIYDSYNMFYTNGHYANGLYEDEKYIEILLENNLLFDNLFEIRPYEHKLGKKLRKEFGETITYYSANPILGNCLSYALKHLDKYKQQAIEIIEFGIENNNRIIKNNPGSHLYVIGDLNCVCSFGNDSFREMAIVAPKEKVEDKQISSLLRKLPIFKPY